MMLVIPGHLLFAYIISYFGPTTLTWEFALVYIFAALIQIWVLLCLAQWGIHHMWKCSIDPDNSAIPYLTALGDCLGGGLLYLTFLLIGEKYSGVGD